MGIGREYWPVLLVSALCGCANDPRLGAALASPAPAAAGSGAVDAGLGPAGAGSAGPAASAPPTAAPAAVTPPSPPSADAGAPRPIADAAADSGESADDAGPISEPAPAGCVDCCPDGFPRRVSAPGARELAAFTPSPEGVTVCPNGDVFVSADDGQLWRVPLDGTPAERWANLEGRQPAGITCDERGRLFVAIFSIRSGGGAPGVMRVDGKDRPGIELPSPSEKPLVSAPNGILALPGLGVYASDSGASWIVRLHETQPDQFSAEIVARDILLANGLAYDPAQHRLFVASSLGMSVLSYQVAADGSLGDPKQVPSATSVFFDGVAVDEAGSVYAADYYGGSVLRLADSKSLAQIGNPASFAFRGSTLLVTDYKLNQPDVAGGLYAIELGVCGALALRPTLPLVH